MNSLTTVLIILYLCEVRQSLSLVQQSLSDIVLDTKDLKNCNEYTQVCNQLSDETYSDCIRCLKYLSVNCSPTAEYQQCTQKAISFDQHSTQFIRSSSSRSSSKSSIDPGSTAGIVISSVAVGLFIIVLIYRKVQQRRQRIREEQAQAATNQLPHKDEHSQGPIQNYDPKHPPQGQEYNPTPFVGQQDIYQQVGGQQPQNPSPWYPQEQYQAPYNGQQAYIPVGQGITQDPNNQYYQQQQMYPQQQQMNPTQPQY